MYEITDATGTVLRCSRPPERVVSLVPSITETLFDLGAGDSLAGITEYCIFPEDLDPDLPRLGGTKNPDIERIRELEPDLVHVNVEENLPRHARQIQQFASVFASEPKSVPDVEQLVADLGRIHGVERNAEEWRRRIAALRKAGESWEPFTFACAIWKDPWMWCGGDTYVSGLVSAVGGNNILENEDRYPRRALEEIVELGPDVVFLPDEPYLFSDAEADQVRSVAPEIEVVGPFPGHLFTWHGTRTARGLEYLLNR